MSSEAQSLLGFVLFVALLAGGITYLLVASFLRANERARSAEDEAARLRHQLEERR